MGRLKEIELRLNQIAKEMENENADIDALSKETNDLLDEKRKLEEKAELRKATLALIGKKYSEDGNENDGKEERKESIADSAEFRSAYLHKLQGKRLSEAEERVLTSAQDSVGAAIPTTLVGKIKERLYQYAPILEEIDLQHIPGGVTYAVEAEPTDANTHVEGAEITEDGDVLIPVTLGYYEITKYVRVSRTAANMTIDAFEDWLSKMIAKRLARKANKLIISGAGQTEATGINTGIEWDESNSITIAKNANLTAGNVTELEALLPGGYDANAKYLMSKKTLFSDFKPLQDKSKNDLFTREGKKYFVDGYEVMLDESIALHEAFLGDFSMYCGNLSEDFGVDTGKLLSKNSYEYLGYGNFDGKPAVPDAFVKLIKATE